MTDLRTSSNPDFACALTPGETIAPASPRCSGSTARMPTPSAASLRAIRSAGMRQFIVESRPHPDYLGPGWWRDLDLILDEAQRLGMAAWICDDGAYPSGHAGNDDVGRIRQNHPHLTKVYLASRIVDAPGPQRGVFFRIAPWIESDEQLVGVVAARRLSPAGDAVDPATLVDFTSRLSAGRLAWDVPEGWWRIFILVRTQKGGEHWTRNYLNPLLPEAADAFIEEVYETHYARYAARFGSTVAGFFTDEPRFGNAGTYDAVLGKYPMVLPWSDDLLEELSRGWDGDFRRVLPALWHDAGELSHRARYRYMDVVSRRFGENYFGRIGRWCRGHGVRLIGHIVEDSNAHARLGYGPGHFFRALAGGDMSGYDIVCQVQPHFTEGLATTGVGSVDVKFHYWGLGPLAASLAELDPSKHGQTMCEIFGAYGWELGLAQMKWLTDHACGRGTNFLIPHAFSPKFPDPDCPPHFFAGGNNPQWRHFHLWTAYAARLCHLLSGGEHVARVAVLYHAEAEWCGDAEHFHHAVAALAKRRSTARSCLSTCWLTTPLPASGGARSRSTGTNFPA